MTRFDKKAEKKRYGRSKNDSQKYHPKKKFIFS